MNVRINSFKNQQGDTRYQLVIGFTSIVVNPSELQAVCDACSSSGFSPKDMPEDK